VSRATNEVTDLLHNLTFTVLIEQLKAYREAKDEAGNPLPIPPAFLAQCLKALKDNGIDSPARAVKMLDALKGAIPDFDDDGEHAGSPH